MSDASATSRVRQWKRPPFIKRRWLRWSLWVGAAVYLALAVASMEVDWGRVIDGLPRAHRFVMAFFPARLRITLRLNPRRHSRELVDDGDLDGGRHRPVGTGCSGGGTQSRPAPVYYLCRAVLACIEDLSRDHPGHLSSSRCLALAPSPAFLRSASAPSAFTASCWPKTSRTWIESQAEAVRATGSSWFQWLNYAVQPQVMPRMIGLGMYRFDINFRESAVVGIVGGGGIGATLLTAFDRYEFDSAAAILIVIIAIVMGVEYSSGFIRHWIK